MNCVRCSTQKFDDMFRTFNAYTSGCTLLNGSVIDVLIAGALNIPMGVSESNEQQQHVKKKEKSK